MNDDELGRLLGEAFDRQARSAVGDQATPPRPRFAADPSTELTPRNSWRRRWWAPVVAAASVVAAVGIGAAVSGGHSSPTAAADPNPTASPSVTSTTADATPVRATAALRSGATVGVGMPVIVILSRPITDGRTLQAVTRVTADGRPLSVAWYFERAVSPAGAMTAHLRPRSYWPAHARIAISAATAGVSAGPGLAFADDLHLQFTTAAAKVATVDGETHRLTLSEDGRVVGDYPVSLGAAATPTSRGVKVIMAKGDPICVDGPGYHDCHVRFTQRLSYDGEYLLGAPWNTSNIGLRDTSNGSTNLRPTDAQQLYRLLGVGDVLDYRNCHGPMMTAAQGYGDWNVPWSTWLTGGLVPTS